MHCVAGAKENDINPECAPERMRLWSQALRWHVCVYDGGVVGFMLHIQQTIHKVY